MLYLLLSKAMIKSESKENQLVIYSVITGGYDHILPVNIKNDNCDYYIISNEHIEVPAPWQLLVLPSESLSNKDFNRFYKINPHLIFPHYQRSLYIDGNILLCGEVSDWSYTNLLDTGFAIYNHPERDNVYDEGKICSFIGTDYFWVINRQLTRYKKERFSSRILFEANILLRAHNEEKVKELMNMWWAEYFNKKTAKRDQLALPYVVWKLDYNIKNMGPSDARFKHEYFKYMDHKSNRHSTLSTKLKKIINRTVGRLCHA